MSRGADHRRGDGYDPLGDEPGEGPGFVVLCWGVAAALLFGLAVVALQYGGPERNRAEALPVPSPVAADQTVAAMPRTDRAEDGALGSEVAALHEEVRRLRQSVDLLRSQADNMALRLGAVEHRGFEEITGSIGRGGEAPAPPVAAAPQAPAPSAPAATPGVERLPSTAADDAGFGLELGTFQDLTSLRNRWRDFVTARPDLFGGLSAVASMRDRGGRTELLLVAGPLGSASEAAATCRTVEDQGIPCAPAFYLGQPLGIP